jgi:hypothetical protein
VRVGDQRLQVRDHAVATGEVHVVELAAARPPCAQRRRAVAGGGERHRGGGGQHARRAPHTDSGVEEHQAVPGRRARRRLAPQVERFVERDPDREREVVVRELAGQEAVQRTAMGEVRDAADGEVVALREPARDVHGCHQPAGQAREAGVLAVAGQLVEQAAREVHAGERERGGSG